MNYVNNSYLNLNFLGFTSLQCRGNRKKSLFKTFLKRFFYFLPYFILFIFVWSLIYSASFYLFYHSFFLIIFSAYYFFFLFIYQYCHLRLICIHTKVKCVFPSLVSVIQMTHTVHVFCKMENTDPSTVCEPRLMKDMYEWGSSVLQVIKV